MTWVILGGEGLLGRHVAAALRRDGASVEALGRAACDVTDPRAVARACRGADVVVNCAAFTAVDRAEGDAAAARAAVAVNAGGVGHVARAAAHHRARFVHVSTDFVFDGRGAPYDVGATPRPLNAYGRSKLDGERAAVAAGPCWLVRVQALFGAGGRGFASRLPELLARAARGGPAPQVDAERRVQPTWAHDAGRQIVALTTRAPPGRYHVSAKGDATWADFAGAVAAALAIPARFEAVATETLGAAAARPMDARFSHRAIAGVGCDLMAPWRPRVVRWLAGVDLASR